MVVCVGFVSVGALHGTTFDNQQDLLVGDAEMKNPLSHVTIFTFVLVTVLLAERAELWVDGSLVHADAICGIYNFDWCFCHADTELTFGINGVDGITTVGKHLNRHLFES